MNAIPARTVAEWIVEFLVTRGVDRVYGLQGGHIQPIWDHLAQRNVRIVDVRDEGAAVHMAHCPRRADRAGGCRPRDRRAGRDQLRDGHRQRAFGTRSGPADRRLRTDPAGRPGTAARRTDTRDDHEANHA